MRDFLESLAGASDLMPHGYCLVWDPELLWLHVGSDVLTGLAYYFIAAALFSLVAKRRDLPFFWMFLLFGAFILACGTTHFMAAWTIYVPSYWLEGIVKMGTAVISIATALLLVRRFSSMLNLPNLSRALEENRQLSQKLGVQVNVLTEEIQKREEVEGQLQRNNALLASLIDAIPDLIFYKNTNSVYLGCNKEFTHFLGRSKDEIIGQNDLNFFPEEVAEFFRGKDREMFRAGVLRRNEEWVEYPDGRRVLLDTIKTPFFDSDNTLLGLIGISRDITEYKQAEQALAQASREWSAAMDASDDVIYLLDLNRHIVRANKTFYLVTGTSPETAIGRHIVGVVHPQGEAIPCPVCLAQEEKRDLQVVMEADCPDNPVGRPLEITVKIIRNQEERPLSILMTLHDLSIARKEMDEKASLERQLQQAQKMESVGRLAGGVAHDFNNMLGVILGHAEMALDRVDPAQPIHADLTEIIKAGKRSADLTRQLLAFARRQTVAPEVLDLNEIVASMLKMLQRLIGEDIQLHWLPAAELWPVRVDPSQIDQILANLCVNARDAIAGVGKLSIETENRVFDEEYCVSHTGFAVGEYVRLAVSDDGRGMDQEIQGHIFDPFFTTKAVGEGTGLGLATVYGIVKQNNGFINVYSEPGRGTTFTIYLPRYVGEVEQARTETAAEPILRSHGTILLVEDESAILEMTRRMLEMQGYAVLAANTPDEALRLAKEHANEIHLLITDVIMPEMNGRDLAEKLQSLYPRLKYLFMSGYTADVIAHHGVLDEGVAFIQKPFSRQELAAKVRKVLDSE